MPKQHLTQRVVDKLPAPHPGGKQTIYWDDELRGFGVQCSGVTNQRQFIAQRDLQNGRTPRITIGATSELKLDAARDQAREILQSMRKGTDPKQKSTTYTL